MGNIKTTNKNEELLTLYLKKLLQKEKNKNNKPFYGVFDK
tara:strand:- start:127 stop:246 length:120 start_codon:yes stop_codon:yes gene_type:complete